jgi:hypothetical protein
MPAKTACGSSKPSPWLCNMHRTLRATLLPLMIRVTAIGYLLFFVPNLLLAVTHHIDTLPPVLARLFDWGGSADATAVMLSTVYVVWAIFLFHSARDPVAHRLFLDFNLVANAAHFAAMLLMALTMPEEHRHATGVFVLGLISTIPLAACWLPVRRTVGPHREITSRVAVSARSLP